MAKFTEPPAKTLRNYAAILQVSAMFNTDLLSQM